MNLKKDVVGQAILTYLNTGKCSEITIEREDGLLFNLPKKEIESYFLEFNDWPYSQKKAIQFAKGRVLDIGAGAGRVALYLQTQGHGVTSIDISPLAIEVCRKRGVKDAKILSIDEVDCFNPHTFDSVILYGSNFGLFGSFDKAKDLLKKLDTITTEDSLIIAESCDPYQVKTRSYLSYYQRNRDLGKMPGQFRMRMRLEDYVGDWFDYLYASKAEMETILKDTAWKVKTYFDSEYTYIAILEKI